MSDEVEARALESLDEALDLDGEARAAFLARVREEQPEVAARVEQLLAADAASDPILEESAVAQVGLPDRGEGRVIGAWRVLRLLGRGGMGAVYLAERHDGQFEQQAALKLIPFAYDRPEVRQRFLAERQILARLRHPRIAQLLDGGVDDEDQPFFVMELAEGEPLTTYTDTRKLGIDERLRLFLQVCDGVHYAHRNLVVHRDLKPSNVLVTRQGVKLLDFGIAKMLDAEDQNLTRTGSRLLTPRYTSPEQIRGQPATTSSDVYGLGLLLYELLCGLPAHALGGDESAARLEDIICTVEPPAPSQRFKENENGGRQRAEQRSSTPERLERRLRGDLDIIVAKALRKEPEQRYSSVEALAADVRRELEHRPIEAHAPSHAYRLKKLWRRNRFAMTSALAIAMLIAMLILTLAVANLRVQRALEQSRIETSKARATAELLSGLFEVSDPSFGEPAPEMTARELLDRGAERLRTELGDQPRVLATLQGEIGEIYFNLGLLEQSRELLSEAITLQRENAQADLASLATNLHRLSLVEDHGGNLERSIELARESVRLRREIHGEDAPETGESLDRLASVLAFAGRMSEAEPLARAAVSKLRQSVGLEDERTRMALHNLAWMLQRKEAYAEAIDTYREILELDSVTLPRHHPALLSTMSNLAVCLRRTGALSEAEALTREVLAGRVSSLGAQHYGVGDTRHNLARLLHAQGRLDEAATEFERALEIWRESLPPEHMSFGIGLSNLARLEIDRGELERATRLMNEALARMRQSLPTPHPRTAEVEKEAAALALRTADYDRALTWARAAVSSYTALGDAPARLAESELLEGLVRMELGDDVDAARSQVERSLRVLESLEDAAVQHELVERARGALAGD